MINSCTFVGRVTKDIDLRYTPNGHAVANFSLALTREIPDQNGDYQTDFISVVVWNKAAESLANNVVKGDLIGFKAHVQTRNYQNTEGKTVYVTEFVMDGFAKFLNIKKWSKNPSTQNHQNNGSSYQQGDPFAHNDGKPIDISDDDLPF